MSVNVTFTSLLTVINMNIIWLLRMGLLLLFSVTTVFATDADENEVQEEYVPFNIMVDKSSDHSMLPRRIVSQYLTRTDEYLTAANGSLLKTFGTASVKLRIGFKKEFDWSFQITDVDLAVMGKDFMTHYGLWLDCKRHRLVDTTTQSFIKIDPNRMFGTSCLDT